MWLGKSLVGDRPSWHKEPIIFFYKMLSIRKVHQSYECVIIISKMFLIYFISYGCNGGALVFLGGAEASASPSFALPMFITIKKKIILHLFLGTPWHTRGYAPGWKYNPHERRCSPGWSVCVCACVCAARSKTDKQSTLWASDASKRSNTHKACKNGRLGEYSLKHSSCLKVNENSWEKIVCQYFVLWQIGASLMLIKEQNAKRKSLTALNLNKVIALSINLINTYSENYAVFFTFDHFLISFVAITYLNINVSRHSWTN